MEVSYCDKRSSLLTENGQKIGLIAAIMTNNWFY